MDEEASTTATDNSYGLITLDSMVRAINKLPTEPTMYAMNWLKVLPGKYLSNNTIIVSMDLAKWLEKKGVIKFLEQPNAEAEIDKPTD